MYPRLEYYRGSMIRPSECRFSSLTAFRRGQRGRREARVRRSLPTTSPAAPLLRFPIVRLEIRMRGLIHYERAFNRRILLSTVFIVCMRVTEPS